MMRSQSIDASFLALSVDDPRNPPFSRSSSSSEESSGSFDLSSPDEVRRITDTNSPVSMPSYFAPKQKSVVAQEKFQKLKDYIDLKFLVFSDPIRSCQNITDLQKDFHPLHFAVSRSRVDYRLLELLIDAGADLEQMDCRGYTVAQIVPYLEDLSSADRIKIIARLQEAGANLWLCDERGKTVLEALLDALYPSNPTEGQEEVSSDELFEHTELLEQIISEEVDSIQKKLQSKERICRLAHALVSNRRVPLESFCDFLHSDKKLFPLGPQNRTVLEQAIRVTNVAAFRLILQQEMINTPILEKSLRLAKSLESKHYASFLQMHKRWGGEIGEYLRENSISEISKEKVAEMAEKKSLVFPGGRLRLIRQEIQLALDVQESYQKGIEREFKERQQRHLRPMNHSHSY